MTNFAHIFYLLKSTHTWDPLIKGTVQYYYEDIIQRRMKDMVSNARTSTEQPSWIKDTIWKVMVDYWEIEEAIQRSCTYSKFRMSDRGGLGPHIHLSGLKSYQQIQDEMVINLHSLFSNCYFKLCDNHCVFCNIVGRGTRKTSVYW